jgi:ABC-2 type transport system ATP-binding protein
MDTRTDAQSRRQDGSTAITVERVSRSFGDVHALREVSFTVGRGQVFGLLGPNGAGKTTLVEILEGNGAPDSGIARVLGADPKTAGAAFRDRMGVAPQMASFELYLTVREHVAAFAGYYRRALPVDELVGLTAKSSALVGRLSGGQMRRLDLALALVGDPDVIFLDEPTTGFDVEARDHAWGVIEALRAAGKTIFLTTHNMAEAQRLTDRVAVLFRGEIAAIGAPADLLPDAAGSRISFRAGSLRPDDLPYSLQHAARFDRGEIVITHEDTPLALYELTGWARDTGVGLPALEVVRPDLEDLYLSIVNESAAASLVG